MTRKRVRSEALDRTLFDQLAHDTDDGQRALVQAERTLLGIAGYVYAHTSLKPVSKTLFLISRCLCVAKLGRIPGTADELSREYAKVRASLNGAAPGDDFDFASVVAECADHIPRIVDAVNEVCQLTAQRDGLGLVFNTLLRGKFEGGEGLGTYLTPEEVVSPMVSMLFDLVGGPSVALLSGSAPLLFGDICGGTGRFVYAIARLLAERGMSRHEIEGSGRLFDQSLMTVDLARLNFLFEGMRPAFERVGDSLTDPRVSSLRSRFLLLATNPPFGSGKYRWNEAVARELPCEVLAPLGMRRRDDSADPSALFFFRNLDLLAPGGCLAIVLPDGVVQSTGFKTAIAAYERARSTHMHVAAIVSLPAVTFALGGTVAKTSFMIVQKEEGASDRRLYVALAAHVGFLKRGQTRADDPEGNDLIGIAEEFGSDCPVLGRLADCWRFHESLVPARLMHAADKEGASTSGTRLSDLAEMVRDFARAPEGGTPQAFHVSVLDVDAMGLLDIVSASRNKPLSRGLACRPGDILVSCMNPRIWRVAVIPNVPGSWSCSPEFVVLRPKDSEDPWELAFALHHPSVSRAIQATARGTSSSRQRVPKDRVLSVTVPQVEVSGTLADYVAWREEFYRKRLREAVAYGSLHRGDSEFSWRP